jgi:phosphoglycolate phosphatase
MSDFAYIFDLDGTLFDSEAQIYNAVNKIRDAAGYSQLDRNIVATLIGLPAQELFQDLYLDKNTEDLLINNFRSELKVLIQESNLMFEGAASFIEKVKKLGYKIGVATSKPTNLAELVVTNSPIKNWVDHIQGTDGFLPKPEPFVIQRCMSQLDVSFGVMFGDRIEDIEAANRAGISSVGIAQTKHSAVELNQAGATIVFSSFIEVLEDFELLSDRLLK